MKRYVYFLGIVMISVSFTACSLHDDLYDSAMVEKQLKDEYSANFIKLFGEVPTDYSWDATSIYPQLSSTRATYEPEFYQPQKGEEHYEVQQSTLNWLKSKLPENTNNQSLGEPFIMTVPGNEFTIVPIYQGHTILRWELHMVVGDVDTKIWERSEGVQFKRYGEWHDLSPEWDSVNNDGVRALPYTFNLTGLSGEAMYFYLKITRGDNRYADEGTQQSSLNHMMLALTCPRPDNIDKSNQVMIIGCEDADKGGTDWDYNDLVFMIYGDPKVPEPIDIVNNTVIETVTKRYMIEDLGSTDDIDFNDIVVDVEQSRTKTITLTNGKITGLSYSNPEQTATIRHLGGTLPFTLTIGDTTLEEMQGQMNVDPNATYDINGWDLETNNIKATIKSKKGESLTVDFPTTGEAPMIIAVSPETKWKVERESITREWFDSLKK